MQAHRQWVLEWMRRRLEGLRLAWGLEWVQKAGTVTLVHGGVSPRTTLPSTFSISYNHCISFGTALILISKRDHAEGTWCVRYRVRHNFTQLTQAGGVAQSLLTALWCRLVLLGSCESFWTAGAACKQFELLLCYCLWFWSFYCETYFKSKVNVLIQFVE